MINIIFASCFIQGKVDWLKEIVYVILNSWGMETSAP